MQLKKEIVAVRRICSSIETFDDDVKRDILVISSILMGLYIGFVLLAAGIYLIMPTSQPRSYRKRMAGGLVIAGGLIGLSTCLARWIGVEIEARVFFVIFALLAIVAAIRVVTHRRPVYSAVYFMLVVLATTGLCIEGTAEFLAAALMIVYGGAILVVYIFVIMLAQQASEAECDHLACEPFLSILLGFLLMSATAQAIVVTNRTSHITSQIYDVQTWLVKGNTINGTLGNTRQIGRTLASNYMIAVQLAGILMLISMVGAIIMARKYIDPSNYTPHEQAKISRPEVAELGRHVEPFASVELTHESC